MSDMNDIEVLVDGKYATGEQAERIIRIVEERNVKTKPRIRHYTLAYAEQLVERERGREETK